MPQNVSKVAIIGLGGFAHAHHDALHAPETEDEVQVIATCDPQKEFSPL